MSFVVPVPYPVSCERVSVVKFSFDDATNGSRQPVVARLSLSWRVRKGDLKQKLLQHMQNADQVNTDTRRVEVRMTPLEELQRKWPR